MEKGIHFQAYFREGAKEVDEEDKQGHVPLGQNRQNQVVACCLKLNARNISYKDGAIISCRLENDSIT